MEPNHDDGDGEDFEWGEIGEQWFVDDPTFVTLLDSIRALPEAEQRRVARVIERVVEDLHEIAELIADARD